MAPDALELDTREPNALVPYAGPEILCQNLLVWAPLS
jgi:hypothetical protein